jgi:hypothetical protein
MIELASFFHDMIFVIGPFYVTGATLSDRIYKICTPLSTGFVENIRESGSQPARKPLPDAPLRGADHSPQCRGR